MKLLISFCNQPANSNKNLLLFDSESGKKEYLLNTKDSFTGLSQDGEYIYALSQNKKTGLVVIDKITKNVILQKKLDEISDPHSLIVIDGFIYIVSTGTDQVIKYKFDKDKKKIAFEKIFWTAPESDGRNDTHHVNSICNRDGSILVSAFGLRKEGGDSSTAKSGYVFNISENKKVLPDIYHPHSLYLLSKDIYYCGSARRNIYKNNGLIINTDEGYVRGLMVNEDNIVLGISNRRKVSRRTGLLYTDNNIENIKESCKLQIYERPQNKLIKEIDFYPFHQEIYDIMEINYSREQLEIMEDNALKKSLTFGQYGRYACIRDIINLNRTREKNTFKILDVGGRGNKLKKFLPRDDVYYIDLEINEQDKNGIVGDACKMSIKNEAFDWVVSADVFEHIEKDKKEDFIKENLRVAKLGVIIAAPFKNDAVINSEINVNEIHKILFNKDHLWLKEHIKIGLPDATNVENFLNKNDYKYQVLNNNNLFLWQLMQSIHFLVLRTPEKFISHKLEEINYYLNSNIYPIDFQEPSYRKIYYIKKKKNLIDHVIRSNENNNRLYLEAEKIGLAFIFEILSHYLMIDANKNWKRRVVTKKTNNKIALFTAIFGDKDEIQEPKNMISNCDFICFTDNKYLKSDYFDIRFSPAVFSDPTRNARMHKVLAHRFLPEYEYTIWVDGNIIVNADYPYIQNLIDTYLKKTDIAMFKHPDRNCIYKEGDACIDLKKDAPDLIKKQLDNYREKGYPINHGLIMSSVVLRKNLSPNVIKINEEWWGEISNYSRRDQLSFNYVSWKNNFKYGIIPGNAYEDDHFIRINHKIRESIASFDDLIKIKNDEIEKLNKEMTMIINSNFWKIQKIYLKSKNLMRNPFLYTKRAIRVLKREGILKLIKYACIKIKRNIL